MDIQPLSYLKNINDGFDHSTRNERLNNIRLVRFDKLYCLTISETDKYLNDISFDIYKYHVSNLRIHEINKKNKMCEAYYLKNEYLQDYQEYLNSNSKIFARIITNNEYNSILKTINDELKIKYGNDYEDIFTERDMKKVEDEIIIDDENDNKNEEDDIDDYDENNDYECELDAYNQLSDEEYDY